MQRYKCQTIKNFSEEVPRSLSPQVKPTLLSTNCKVGGLIQETHILPLMYLSECVNVSYKYKHCVIVWYVEWDWENAVST